MALPIVGNAAAAYASSSSTTTTVTTSTTSSSTISSSAGTGNIPANGEQQNVKQTDAASAQQQAKTQLNVSIVKASLDVSISSQNDPLALLYKSAITSLNETLKADLGENAIQNAASQDNSAEGTADRIVKLSTGFFEQFKKQHVGEDEGEVLKKFMSTIRGGFEQGFNEAKDILGGLKVLNGDIAGNVDKTHELVQKGYADFEAAQSGKSADATAAPTKPAAKAG